MASTGVEKNVKKKSILAALATGADEQAPSVPSPSTEKDVAGVNVVEDDLVSELRRLLEDHHMDPNFPRKMLDRARNYLEHIKHNPEDPELAQGIVQELVAHKDLVLNNSAYPEVRAVVDPTDDPTLPVATFRVFVIGTLFTVAGTGIAQFFSLRMPSIGISTYVVQLLSMPLGKLMARVLSTRIWRIGRWQFTLNPGPFSQKEHILIAMMANVSFGGSCHGAYIVTIIQVLKLDVFYGEKTLANSIPWQIMTLLSTQLLGYGCAGMARRFLVYPASMIWQRTLANLALTKALHGTSGDLEKAHGWTISRYRFFIYCFIAMFIWFWVPNYFFEGLAIFNWPTWISPSSIKLALFAGSFCGLGLNPLPTLDWNVATHFGDPIITPLFTLLNFASGMALIGFFVAPILYFNNLWESGHFPINSNRMFDNTGERYNITRILNDDFTLNHTAYLDYSVPLLSTTMILNFAAIFTTYVAIPVHVFLWHRKHIVRGVKATWSRQTRAEEFQDIHNRLMSVYPECPQWWYLAVLALSFILACISVSLWPTGTPVWAIILALLFTLILQIPLGIIAAMANVDIPTSILAMAIGGYALEGKAIPNMIFKMFSYMSTSQSLNFTADLKLAHYAKIPPRTAFAAQIYATMVAGVIAMGVNHYVLENIDNICQDSQKDRFTCPGLHSYFMSTVLWGVIGPRRLFGIGAPYTAVTYVMPLGLILPPLVYFFAKRWPRSLWRKFHAPIFMAGPLGWAPYNWSYMQGTIMLALFFNFFIKRRYTTWWERYAYVLTSSFMAAIGIAGLVMFFALQKQNIRLEWWGNHVARQGVDMGGFLGPDNKPVRCANLAIPEKGFFDIGFEWKV